MAEWTPKNTRILKHWTVMGPKLIGRRVRYQHRIGTIKWLVNDSGGVYILPPLEDDMRFWNVDSLTILPKYKLFPREKR